jgi:hypothetical protein
MCSKRAVLAVFIVLLAGFAAVSSAEICQGYGPQTPRDIDQKAGTNPVLFSPAPGHRQMNLCDIHFHKQAENKARDFSLSAGDSRYGGFRCNETTRLTLPELRPLLENQCSNVAAGDTVEVHWVYTSCRVEPGPTLNSCFSEACPNPNLRVEAQVFLLVNDPSADDFAGYDYGGIVDGYHQAKALPSDTGEPVEFLGSTTGPSFSDEKCSQFQVTWEVRPRCAKLDVSSLSQWCSDNLFEEHGAHGVRQLVEDRALLSKIP